MIDAGKLSRPFQQRALPVGGDAIGVTLAALAAYVLARDRTRLHRIIYLFIIMGIAMPTNFVTLDEGHADDAADQHAARDHPALRRLAIPFSVFLIYAFIQTLPRDLDEAAIVDGCTPFRLFWSIIFPVADAGAGDAGVLTC